MCVCEGGGDGKGEEGGTCVFNVDTSIVLGTLRVCHLSFIYVPCAFFFS